MSRCLQREFSSLCDGMRSTYGPGQHVHTANARSRALTQAHTPPPPPTRLGRRDPVPKGLKSILILAPSSRRNLSDGAEACVGGHSAVGMMASGVDSISRRQPHLLASARTVIALVLATSCMRHWAPFTLLHLWNHTHFLTRASSPSPLHGSDPAPSPLSPLPRSRPHLSRHGVRLRRPVHEPHALVHCVAEELRVIAFF